MMIRCCVLIGGQSPLNSMNEIILLILICALTVNTYVTYKSVKNENEKRIEEVETELKRFMGQKND